MLEKYLIEHCSPTLASLKTANLMNIPFESENELDLSVELLNSQLSKKGIELLILKKTESSALVYAYRKSKLASDLSQKGVAELLREYGYESVDVEYCISRLKSRLALSGEFPHEIGVFLGYPLGDVVGFIDNAGQNCKCIGCWKVYCNECEAIRTFAKFNKCKHVYKRLGQDGRSLAKLTV